MSKWMLLMAVAMAGTTAGCVGESNISDRQDAAMRDPFSYSPYDNAKSDSSVSRPKQGTISRDVNSVFNP